MLRGGFRKPHRSVLIVACRKVIGYNIVEAPKIMISHNQILYDGTGVAKVLRAMQANGSPLPRFDTDDDRTYFTTFLPIHALAISSASQARDQVTPQVTPQVTLQVQGIMESERVQVVLSFCISPHGRAEIQEEINLKDVRNLRERYLVPLVAAGLLAMTDPEHPTSPMQKYVTTPLGIAALRQLEKSEV